MEADKTYMDPEPVEIRIYVDYIQIINFPGPYRWIDMDKFASGKVRARKYRNRRIGEFLKDIDLSEKQSTGITKILRELQQNGSPEPEFETDDDRTYLITTIRAREGFYHGRMEETIDAPEDILSQKFSALEQERMDVVMEYLHQNGRIRSNTAAEILNVQIKAAQRLLKKAEENGILSSDGRTKVKTYFIK